MSLFPRGRHSLASFSIIALTASLFAGIYASAQVRTNARPSVRITDKVDNTQVTHLAGTHPGIVDRAVIGARLASSTPMKQMHLVLTSSDEQLEALHALGDQQQDRTSPNFHQWLTPESFGEHFGVAQTDIASITSWLQDQGFSIDSVSKGRRVITFSGTSGQVEAAFQTEMHSLTVDGANHISNISDITVPTAFSKVVLGVARLNDIFPTSSIHPMGTAKYDPLVLGGTFITPNNGPEYGTATSTHYVVPGDVATIYNAGPLKTGGIDGTGTTIAIVAQSDINLADVEQFRYMFGLPKNDPTIVLVGADPGLNGDDGEAYLDAEWSGAVATGATVQFIVSNPDLEYGGIDASGLYIVDNNVADIISMSYGGCETNNGAANTAFWNILWEQAAAQGQTAFISTGDSSAAGCNASNSNYATSGYGVNALGSSAYNVAVGGSTFIDYGPATYWGANGTTIPFTNALSYIPEEPWNNSKLGVTLNSASTGTSTGSGIGGSGGGISIYTARPNWQTGSGISPTADPAATSGTGIASGSPISGVHRLVPDVVNIAANNHDGAAFCSSSICATTASGGVGNFGIVGGTSVATPVQAGLQALINEKNGGRQGNVNYYYYKLAAAQYASSTTACQSKVGTAASPTVTLPASTCNFNDIVAGGNNVPTSSSDTTGIGFKSAVGYDPASGLGSMNVSNVANNWSTVTFTATTTTLAISPSVSQHGATQNIAVTVVPTTGTGTPTGDFSLIATTALPNGPFQYTLSGGTYSGTIASGQVVNISGANLAALPAGSYNVHAHYAGDLTFGGSDSNAVPVVISKETSSINMTSYLTTQSTNPSVTAQATFTYGSNITLDTYVVPTSGAGNPTGTVTYTVVQNGSTTLGTVTNTLDATGNTYLMSGAAIPADYLKPNFRALPGGTYVVTAVYSGDNNFASSTTTIGFTVTGINPAVTFTGPVDIAGGTAQYIYSIANPLSTTYPNTTVPATGTVTFTDTTTSTALGTCTLAGTQTATSTGACVFSTTLITVTGGNTISAAYSGDSNYNAATNTVTTTVVTTAAPTVTVTTTTGTPTFGSTVVLKAALNPTAATGTVSFYVNGTYVGAGTLSGGAVSFNATSGNMPGGSDTVTAVYSGSSTYASATGTATISVVKKTYTMTASAPATSTYGQTVAVSVAIITGSTTAPIVAPTGGVNIYDNGTLVGNGPMTFDPSGYGYFSATIAVTNLSGGTHNFSASFGDGNYTTVTATVSNSTVIAALTPTVALTSPATVYAPSASVAVSATIPAASNLAVPTGGINFYDGSTLLGPGTLAYSGAAGGFVATYTTTTLARGTHSLTAVLGADTNYNSATSPALSVTVNIGNVWIANGNGTVSALTNAGTAITTSAVGSGGQVIAIDNVGDVWSLNSSTNSVAEISNTGTLLSSGYTGGGITAPTTLTIDGQGYIWIANGNSTISVLNSTGTPVSTTAYKTSLSTPTTINVDGSGNLWITNAGDASLTEVIGVAAPVTTPTTTAVKNGTLATKP